MKAHEILNQAQTEMQDRAKTYDKPQGERSMGACVAAFEAITRVKLTVEQGWLFMCLLKAVRSQQGDYRADNYVDLAAYAGLMGEAASDQDYRDRRLNGLRAMKDEAMGLPKHSQPVSPFECRSSYSDELKTIFNDAFRSTEIPGWHDITPEEDEAWSRRESQIFEDAWNEAKNQEFAEQWDEKRMDVIGQNGNGAEHYNFESDNQTVDHEGRLYIRATDRSDYVFGHYGAYFEPAFMDGGPFVFVCDRCGEIYSATDEVEQCPGQPCGHTAGFHNLSSTSEKICIDCKQVMPGKDDAKLTTHKRVSSGKVGPDT